MKNLERVLNNMNKAEALEVVLTENFWNKTNNNR